ncbi:MAG: AAA family ATPase [Neisseriaceae bacterium]|nr:MAG: AAA family ATPase [Neisseriaceae bacterium]
MSGMIKKIDYIQNMAVYQDFKWNLKEKNNTEVSFEKINIFYGRNCSGKTTLSRIFKVLEKKQLPDKYQNLKFSVSVGKKTVTHEDLSNENSSGSLPIVRVFNQDFIQENLGFIFDEERSITGFAVLGKHNLETEQKIKELYKELGSKEDKTGLRGKLAKAEYYFHQSDNELKSLSKKLEQRLRVKATEDRDIAIKYNKIFGDPNYNIKNIEKDVLYLLKKGYQPINSDQKDKFEKICREEAKPRIEKPVFPSLGCLDLISEAKELIERKISISKPIQELIENNALAHWVRQGMEYHRHRETCAFCGNIISPDLWPKLEQHFNLESKNLEQKLDKLIDWIKKEKEHITTFPKIDYTIYYSNDFKVLKDLEARIDRYLLKYRDCLNEIKVQINNRKNNIIKPIEFKAPEIDINEYGNIKNTWEHIIDTSNEYTDNLGEWKTKAKESLRLYDVHCYIQSIGFLEKYGEIVEKRKESSGFQKAKESLEKEISNKENEIEKLRSQLEDKQAAVKKINDYLEFGLEYPSFCLKVVNEDKKQYQFEIVRINGKIDNEKADAEKAYNLSQGERNLIAFCYFLVSLESINQQLNENEKPKPIIWIDDPISSLDSNHIFFAYSLIKTLIVDPGNFQQLFISTHNLEFLQFLKRMPGRKKQFFILERDKDKGDIRLMPDYLRNYITEFNYLFHQIYKCAEGEPNNNDYHMIYSFANNARRFLELYLYYQYPDGDEKRKNDRLKEFFDPNMECVNFIDRVTNEYSHSLGLERGSLPIETIEIRQVAKKIIAKLKENNKSQYEAFLKSIGVDEEEIVKNNLGYYLRNE